MEEVATMVTTTMTRPSMLLPAVCSLSAPKPAATPVLAEAWAPIPQVHQVQTQAELALVDGGTNGINGTTGFMGLGGSSKRYVDERGIPPREGPV
jgi:hypothetical protein